MYPYMYFYFRDEDLNTHSVYCRLFYNTVVPILSLCTWRSASFSRVAKCRSQVNRIRGCNGQQEVTLAPKPCPSYSACGRHSEK